MYTLSLSRKITLYLYTSSGKAGSRCGTALKKYRHTRLVILKIQQVNSIKQYYELRLGFWKQVNTIGVVTIVTVILITLYYTLNH